MAIYQLHLRSRKEKLEIQTHHLQRSVHANDSTQLMRVMMMLLQGFLLCCCKVRMSTPAVQNHIISKSYFLS